MSRGQKKATPIDTVERARRAKLERRGSPRAVARQLALEVVGRRFMTLDKRLHDAVAAGLTFDELSPATQALPYIKQTFEKTHASRQSESWPSSKLFETRDDDEFPSMPGDSEAFADAVRREIERSRDIVGIALNSDVYELQRYVDGWYAQGMRYEDVPAEAADIWRLRFAFSWAASKFETFHKRQRSEEARAAASRGGKATVADKQQRKAERQEYWRSLAADMVKAMPMITKDEIVDAVLRGWKGEDGRTEDGVDANAVSRSFSIRELKKSLIRK